MRKLIKNLYEKIFDMYLEAPIFYDLLVIVIIWILSVYCPLIQIGEIERNNQLAIISNIINTDVSLAGFILAALTIIVTFKSNITIKGMEEANNAQELIFSSKHYVSIVEVFKKGIIELVLCLVILSCFWSNADSFETITIYRINISGIILTSASIIRCLYILFIILHLSNKKKEDS